MLQSLQLRSTRKSAPVLYLSSLTKGSRRVQYSALNTIAAMLAGKASDPLLFPWHQLDRTMLHMLRLELGKSYATATANRYLSALRGVLKECWRMELIDSDAYHRLSDISNIKGKTITAGRFIPREDITKILEYFQGGSTYQAARNFVMISIMYYAGLRRAEVCDLRLRDWNALENSLLVRGKGNKERLVYVYKDMREIIMIWMGLHDGELADGPLFARVREKHSYSGEKLSTSGIYHILRQAQVATGVEKFSPHDLRRTCFTNLLNKGVDLATVSKMAGHSNLQTTAMYDMRDETAKKEAFQLLELPVLA